MSSFDEKWRKRRRGNPFDFFGLPIVTFMMNLMFRDFGSNWMKPGSSFFHGFNIHFGSDGNPHIEQFGNRPLKNSEGERSISEEREPLTDIIEGEEEIAITIELPGVEKDDIDLNVTESNLEINVENPKRKYRKLIDLPCDVIPKTSKASYKNGILDIVIKRKEKKQMKMGSE